MHDQHSIKCDIFPCRLVYETLKYFNNVFSVRVKAPKWHLHYSAPIFLLEIEGKWKLQSGTSNNDFVSPGFPGLDSYTIFIVMYILFLWVNITNHKINSGGFFDRDTVHPLSLLTVGVVTGVDRHEDDSQP